MIGRRDADGTVLASNAAFEAERSWQDANPGLSG